jgi:hypothetical protein
VVDVVRAENALLGALIEEAEPVAVAGRELTVAFAASAPFLKKKAEDRANRATVTAALDSVMGGRWRLRYALDGELEGQRRSKPRASSEEEWVSRLMEEFDAEELSAEWAGAPSDAHAIADPGGGASAGHEGG